MFRPLPCPHPSARQCPRSPCQLSAQPLCTWRFAFLPVISGSVLMPHVFLRGLWSREGRGPGAAAWGQHMARVAGLGAPWPGRLPLRQERGCGAAQASGRARGGVSRGDRQTERRKEVGLLLTHLEAVTDSAQGGPPKDKSTARSSETTEVTSSVLCVTSSGKGLGGN